MLARKVLPVGCDARGERVVAVKPVEEPEHLCSGLGGGALGLWGSGALGLLGSVAWEVGLLGSGALGGFGTHLGGSRTSSRDERQTGT